MRAEKKSVLGSLTATFRTLRNRTGPADHF